MEPLHARDEDVDAPIELLNNRAQARRSSAGRVIPRFARPLHRSLRKWSPSPSKLGEDLREPARRS